SKISLIININMVIGRITIFIFIIKLIFDFLIKALAPLSTFIATKTSWNDTIVNIFAIGSIILFCFVMGLLIKTRFGKNLFGSIEKAYLEKLPLYGTIKEIVQQFSGAKKMPFSEVVTVEVFSNGTKMTGFITEEHANGSYTVFVPTGPNPTNGFIFHVTEDQIERKDTTTEEAMRSIIGVGVGSEKVLHPQSHQGETEA
ncbi:MAG: DUF502 domain-containing protein, partial [Bacteroidota bacterium]